MKRFLFSLVFPSVFLFSCQHPDGRLVTPSVDPDLTPETKALYMNLHKVAGKFIMFGQQDALLYGAERKMGIDSEVCDIKLVTGVYPAVCGWDIGHVLENWNIDSVPFSGMIPLIKAHYSRGGINTISWHEKNPLTNHSCFDTTRVVDKLLPGGQLNGYFKILLNHAGNFIRNLKDEEGKPIPVVFRPFHEHNGDWFWWGTKSCSPQEFIKLWRFMVHYLRDSMQIHQILYAISPDRSRMKNPCDPTDFFYAYPGDEYVDIIGLDNYWDVGRSADYISGISGVEQDSLFLCNLRALVKAAESRGKIAALTETGINNYTNKQWFTDCLIKPFKTDSLARRVVYILVWRNTSVTSYYTPYPGSPLEEDFRRFQKDPLMVFLDRIPDFYSEKDN
ncbi:MAG: glycoside hydrolase family 26 protein [Bacteroidales bacterium]